LELDRIISGLKPGKLYIFAARPGVGKTSLITQILTAVAKQNTPCLYYPTEVGAEPVWDKMVSSETNIGLLKFQNGDFADADRLKIIECMARLEKLPLSIVEDFAVTPDKVEAGILKYLPERPGTYRGVVAVDFLQSLAWEDPESVAEKSQAVYRFKKMCKDYNVPFILASQLNRGDGAAALTQLKGTGALEEYGDCISFIYQTGDKFSYPVKTDLNIMKSKYSATGICKLNFYKSHCRFEPDIEAQKVVD
jgi:replicative DNA helicase